MGFELSVARRCYWCLLLLLCLLKKQSIYVFFPVAKDCGDLTVPVNGSRIGNENTFPNRVSFNCDAGFDLIGSAVRKCEANGRWSGEQPSCNGNVYSFVVFFTSPTDEKQAVLILHQ